MKTMGEITFLTEIKFETWKNIKELKKIKPETLEFYRQNDYANKIEN